MARAWLGIAVGAFLVVSFFAHSVAGWSVLRQELVTAGLPAELVVPMDVGWRLGGAAMLAFGAVTLHTFTERLRGRTPSRVPVGIVAATYAVYGGWAWVTAAFDPFFLVLFVVPGALLGVAAWPERR